MTTNISRYHSKCFKLARGKVKEDDRYTCPICDWRVKIPRDATRPKLDDLLAWQDEIPSLPFQPEEEETLESIIDHGSKFRDYVARHINPVMSSPDELTTQRFYLRKLEGADILLAEEINFFRQELHKWAPVAPTPPPPISVSLSTRKPRPTKQQKLMNQLGLSKPEQLPADLRRKSQTFKPRETSHDNSAYGGLHPAAEQSHTPPGEPPTLREDFPDQGYFPPATYNNSPPFTASPSLNYGSSMQPISSVLDPDLFQHGAHGPVSPLRENEMFRSSGNGQEMFAEPMDDAPREAEDALAVTEGNSYLD